MMRFCPKCGDYYADALLAFCLVDGAPLINVDANSEGARVIEEKENALKQQKRKLRLRRVMLGAMMLLTTLILFVVAINSFTYLQTSPIPPPVADAMPPPTPTPTPIINPTPTTNPTPTPTLTPTPTPTLILTPTPTPVYKISGRVTRTDGSGVAGLTLTLSGSKSVVAATDAGGNYVLANLPAGGNYVVALSKSNYSFTPSSRTINNLDSNRTANFTGTLVSYQIRGRVTVNGEALRGVSLTLSGSQSRTLTTGMNGSYAFGDLPAGGSYTITPSSAKIVFQPPSRSINKLTQDESADFVGREQHEQAKCSVVDQSREYQTIINQYGAEWRRKIEGERQRIISERVPVRIPNANGLPGFVIPEVTLGAIEYESKFPKACTASVTARYVWRVRTNFNGRAEDLTIPREKRFACAKIGETWRCR